MSRQIESIKPARPDRRWVRPELVRFEAGEAEFGDFVSPDAQPSLS